MIRPPASKKNRIALLCVLCALTALAGVCMGVFYSAAGKLQSQRAADSFRGESKDRFSQVTAFFPVGKGIAETDVYTFRQSIDAGLLAASLEAPETGSLYTDAYSAKGEVTVKGQRGSATAAAVGVGGDYFLFHPLYLRSGGYINGDDLMHDRVVLDEELAWKLYGGVELEGLTVSIGGTDYIIAGVVSRETDRFSQEAYSDGAGLYMAYDSLNAISETQISCYELVCADPISGFALELVKTGFPKAAAVENTGRFTLERSFGVIRHFGQRTLSTEGVVYPYWENAARLAENRQALFLLLAIIFIIAPFAAVVITAAALLKRLKDAIKAALPAYLERRQERRYRKRMESKGE